MTLIDSIRGSKREIDQKKERNEKIEFTSYTMSVLLTCLSCKNDNLLYTFSRN